MSKASFGKYRLLAELGHGGMADVFLAVAAGPAGSGFSKLTVIKRLRENFAEEPDFVSMLVDEARIAARLNHPNVVQTNEVGQVGKHYFLAMEYLDGQPLHRVMHRRNEAKSRGKDVFDSSLLYLAVVDALAGLHHAHEMKDYDGKPLEIVHRDVTPHNIFVTYEGQVKVVDFGVAKAAGRTSETREGVIKGKVRYMAPEQALGKSIDRRADVFAAGVILWEAATERRMWKDMDDIQIVNAFINGTMPPPPRELAPNVPEALDRICRKALGYDPNTRYATADDFRRDLEQFLADQGVLVEARRKIGPATSDLFADKRDEIRAVIESQLSALTARPSMELATVPVFDSASSTSLANPPASSFEVDETRSAAMTDVSPEPNRVRGRSPKHLVALGAIALAVCAVFAWTFVQRQTLQTTPTTPETATLAKAEQVYVTLIAQPPSARIRIDDRDLGNAYRGHMTKDERDHRIVVMADGFSSHEETITLTSDVTREFQLSATEPQAAVTPRSSAANARGVPSAPAKPHTVTPPITAPTQPPATAEPTTTSHARPDPSARRKRNIDNNDPWGEAPP